ncbi:MAG: RNA polymerase sigma factor [Chloracidobacterium sp.]|nr:RNA polymerase sigma factor [Chloracidobacterium sp.]
MMPKLARDKSAVVDEIFDENYPAMMRWANVVSNNNKPLSEDLVHDVFIKCKRSPSDLSEIENIKSFLFTAIKNTYVSQLRRKTSRREVPIVDEMSPNSMGLVHDPRISGAARDQLLDICYYACKRKEKSISASVLIFRYFLGYYPFEIKKLLKRPQNSVEVRMSKVRAEVTEYLCGEGRMEKSNQGIKKESQLNNHNTTGDNLTAEIQSIIFLHASGKCLSANEWRRLYLKSNEIGREDISHLVSCLSCLDTVNELLRIPLLRHRHPLDSCNVQPQRRFLDSGGIQTTVFAILIVLITAFVNSGRAF